MRKRKIAVIGEKNLAHVSHQGIERSVAAFRRHFDPALGYSWIGTNTIDSKSVDTVLRDVTGVWCAPGSPYASTEGAFLAIRHARLHGKAFLGTCGGFQHALMEFAQNVLARPAEHAELNPGATEPLIMKLSCSLVGAKGKVLATDSPRFSALLGGSESVEEFHCNYGFNADLAGLFDGSALKFVAHDERGQVRAFRLEGHPFYVGTLFQPERRALGGPLHALVEAFLRAS